MERRKESRVNNILREYAANWNDDVRDQICHKIETGFAKHLARDEIQHLKSLVIGRDLTTAVGSMLDVRYDPLYDRKLAKSKARVIASFDVTDGFESAMGFVRMYHPSESSEMSCE